MKKIVWIIILIIIIVILIIGFNSDEENKLSSETIKIGHVSPLSGDAATYGGPMRNAAQIAVDEINASGGIDGRQIEIIYEDSKCTGKEALSATQKLISVDGVKVISGFTCAEDVLISAPVIEENKVVALAPGASGPNVTFAGDYIFQVNPSATVAVRKLSELMTERHRNVAVISENTGFATDARDYFVEQVDSLGGNVIVSETYNSDVRDFRTLLTKMLDKNPEAIFVNPQTEIAGATIMKQARELGIESAFYGGDTITGNTTFEIAGDAIEGLTVISVPGLDPDNQKAKDFLEKYKDKFGDPVFDLYLGSAYDSIYLIKESIENVGEDTDKIRDYLYDLEGRSGVIGSYGFDENGDLDGIEFLVKQFKNGEFVEVK